MNKITEHFNLDFESSMAWKDDQRFRTKVFDNHKDVIMGFFKAIRRVVQEELDKKIEVDKQLSENILEKVKEEATELLKKELDRHEVDVDYISCTPTVYIRREKKQIRGYEEYDSTYKPYKGRVVRDLIFYASSIDPSTKKTLVNLKSYATDVFKSHLDDFMKDNNIKTTLSLTITLGESDTSRTGAGLRSYQAALKKVLNGCKDKLYDIYIGFYDKILNHYMSNPSAGKIEISLFGNGHTTSPGHGEISTDSKNYRSSKYFKDRPSYVNASITFGRTYHGSPNFQVNEQVYINALMKWFKQLPDDVISAFKSYTAKYLKARGYYHEIQDRWHKSGVLKVTTGERGKSLTPLGWMWIDKASDEHLQSLGIYTRDQMELARGNLGDGSKPPKTLDDFQLSKIIKNNESLVNLILYKAFGEK